MNYDDIKEMIVFFVDEAKRTLKILEMPDKEEHEKAMLIIERLKEIQKTTNKETIARNELIEKVADMFLKDYTEKQVIKQLKKIIKKLEEKSETDERTEGYN